MTWLNTVRRRGEKEYCYLSLVEAVRVAGKVTHRTLLRLGEVTELRQSGQLDRIIGSLQAHAAGTWLPAGGLVADGAPGFGAVAGVHAVFVRLGLDTHYSGARKHSDQRLNVELSGDERLVSDTKRSAASSRGDPRSNSIVIVKRPGSRCRPRSQPVEGSDVSAWLPADGTVVPSELEPAAPATD